MSILKKWIACISNHEVEAEKASAAISTHLPINCMIQNFHLVWLDANIDEVNNEDCRNSITKLRQIVNTINTFTDVDLCIDFIDTIKEEKTFLISSGALGQTTIPLLHNKPQVNTIYIFCKNKGRHEEWTKGWPKIKGVFTDIIPICEALKQAAQDCDHNSVSISFVQNTAGSSNHNLNTLDQSFMYTQILKEILLTIDFDQSHINEFLSYCCAELAENPSELRNVERLRTEYHQHRPIWWYTYQSFLYSMLNRALRLMEVDRIILMGFFVRDLHQHIARLHVIQYGEQNNLSSFTVYRGQGLSQTDFDQLKNSQGGLLAFNNFVSTSRNSNVSLRFARRMVATSNLVGVQFVMTIDPSITATPFADVSDVGYYQAKEEEILLSMHSVFRIGQIKQIDENNRLWQVNLMMTSDNDPQLHALTESMQEETKGSTGWLRLGKLLVKLAQYNKAEDLHNILLNQSTYDHEKGNIFYQLGCIKFHQANFTKAIEFFQSALEIRERTISSQCPDVADCYNNIAIVYNNMKEYSRALLYYEKALEIYQKTLFENHPSLATSYSNIGAVFYNMEEYSDALSHYEKALKIYEKTLPKNHPDLATSYNNIGLVYKKMGDYPKALSYYQLALDIKTRSLPRDHPSIENVTEIIEIVKMKL